MIFTIRDINDPLSPFDISLWIFSIALAYGFAIFTVLKHIKNEKELRKLQKVNVFTWAITFALWGTSNILNIIWRYAVNDVALSSAVDNVSVLFVNIGVLFKIFSTEYSINRYGFYKSYYCTPALIGLAAFTFLVSPEILRTIGPLQVIYLVLLVVGVSIVPLLFLYIAIKLKADERKMSLRILIGYAFLFVGLLFQPHNTINYTIALSMPEVLANAFLIICPILISLGIIIMFKSYSNIL